MQIPSSELVLNSFQEVYHLGLNSDDIADRIILVGDQNRVRQVADQFDSIRLRKNHREFYTISGTYKGKPLTVLSSGIGTDNIDIVLNELDALVNIDLKTRRVNQQKRQLEILRIGTCGIFQKNVPLNSYCLSIGAFGLDNVGHFYADLFSVEEKRKAMLFSEQVCIPQTIIPYYSDARPEIFNRLNHENKVIPGYTVTSSGFYGPQGRTLRLALKDQQMKTSFENQQIENLPILNFEMESSALFYLANALGHKAGTICLGIANRVTNEFSKDYTKEMDQLISYSLDCLSNS